MDRKYSSLRVGATAAALLLTNFVAGQSGSSQPPARPKVAEETFKNIKVLKGLPSDQLIPSMQFITYSLGVECSFCHAEGAFEKDDKKPKETARKMMQMMAAINQQNFDAKREVTCYSCHRGAQRPVAIPVIADASAPATGENISDENAAAVPGPGAVDQILAKYLEVTGGAQAVARLKTLVEKGTITLGGRQIPIDIVSKNEGKRLQVIHLPNGENATAYDGNTGWTSAPNRPVRDVPGVEIASARVESDLQLPAHLKQIFSELKLSKPEKIGEQEVDVISGFSRGELAAKFYFDKKSGMLLRILRYVNSPLGLNPTQIDYSDYRDQQGVKLSFLQTVARPNSRFKIQIDEAKYNEPVDDARFARPSSEPAKPPSP